MGQFIRFEPRPGGLAARGEGGDGRRSGRAWGGERGVFWAKRESKKGKEHEYGHALWEMHL